MYRLFTALSLAVLAGCSQDKGSEPTAKTSTSEISSVEQISGPQLFSKEDGSGAAHAIGEAESLSTSSLSAAVNLESEVIEEKPSDFPAIMARTVELRKKIQDYDDNSKSLPKSLVEEIQAFSLIVTEFANSEAILTKDQRENISMYAGKAEYQASQIIEGNVKEPFSDWLSGVKFNLEKVQESLSKTETSVPN